MHKVYSNDLSLTVKVTTSMVFILIALIISIVLNWKAEITFKLLISFIILGVFLLPLFFYPRKVILEENAIKVIRFGKDILINYSKIFDLKALKDEKIRMIGIIGSDGIFGHLGLYYLRGYGKAWCYLTNPKKPIILILKNGKKFAFSLKEDDEFMRELNLKLKKLRNEV
ncbi:MAG: PH domain-containing protein [Nitrososphaerales archaeon]